MNPHRTVVDITDLIFLLAAFGFFLLQRFLKGEPKPGQKPVPKPLPAGDQEPAFDDALVEIRRALGMEPIPQSPGPIPEAGPPRPAPVPAPRPRIERPTDEFHRVRTGRPDAEERFERGASVFRDPLKGHTHAKPARKAVESVPAVPRRQRLLATKKQLRDAFVLKEIGGPPRARKKEIR